MADYDYALVGGGLQNGLMAVALRHRQPGARILLLERADRLGGNHTWCFHARDVDDAMHPWLDPLVVVSWPGYDIHFPSHTVEVEDSYRCVTSERLDEVVRVALSAPGCAVGLDSDVREVRADRVVLASGEEVSATVVVDGRGARADAARRSGYQKFVGLEVELQSGHGRSRATLMDARVHQREGYRFMYVLPFSERRLLLEDTYFHQDPTLDVARIRDEIRAYADGQGWIIRSIVREETGVLPMPWRDPLPDPTRGPLRAGYAGGWFHPGTGYSFPIAARLAQWVADRSPERVYGGELWRLWRDHRGQARFAHFLNRLLFRWYPPTERRGIFERFYRLPTSTIRNFYRLTLTAADRRRLLVGRPPPGLSLSYRLRGGSR